MMKKSFMKHGAHEQDFELNIASIIDCFVVLIAFVLVSTSFFSIGIIDAEIAGASDAAETDPSDSIVIELKADRSIEVRSAVASEGVAFRIEGKMDPKKRMKSWDFERLTDSLHAMKEKKPDIRSAVLMADNSVAYRDVMASMEVAKAEVPSVNLGGF
jgi:biopolymer transport protein ExbD